MARHELDALLIWCLIIFIGGMMIAIEIGDRRSALKENRKKRAHLALIKRAEKEIEELR